MPRSYQPRSPREQPPTPRLAHFDSSDDLDRAARASGPGGSADGWARVRRVREMYCGPMSWLWAVCVLGPLVLLCPCGAQLRRATRARGPA